MSELTQALEADVLTHNDCIEGPDHCGGEVEYRFPLSATGRSFPRCDHHWSKRLDREEITRRRYPSSQPTDFEPSYAGESW